MHDNHDAPQPRSKGLGTRSLRVGLGALIVSLLLGFASAFQVMEGTSGVVTRFGRPVREAREAGFYWKLPWPLERVYTIDTRKRVFNATETGTLTKDQTNVILLTYVVWQVDQPLTFLQAFGAKDDPQEIRKDAERKLDSVINAAKNQYIGNYPLTAFVSTSPGDIQTESLEAEMLAHLKAAVKDFGIVVEQVGVKRIAYPKMNMTAALKQMSAERRSRAIDFRAQGEKEAKLIRNEALARAAEIRKEGKQEAGRIRGRAEHDAAGYYEAAEQLDPEFYRFWRALEAVRRTLGAKTTVVLRNDQSPFDALFEPPQPSRREPLGAADP